MRLKSMEYNGLCPVSMSFIGVYSSAYITHYVCHCLGTVVERFRCATLKRKFIILMTFSSLAALEVVKMTTSSAASDENFVKMTNCRQ